MKKDYRYYLASSGLSADNIAYLESIEAVNPSDSRLNGLQSDYEATAALTKEAVVDLFKQQAQSTKTMSQVNSNAHIFTEIGYRFANLDPLKAPLTEQAIIKGLAKQGYAVNEPIDPQLIKQFCGTSAIDVSGVMDQTIKADILKQFTTEIKLSDAEKKKVLKDLIAANDFEKYLDLKFVGQKRFSLEGNDAVIPFINRVIDRLHEYHYTSFSAGMAHRGRLSVMLNVFGMLSGTLLDMFSGKAKSISKTSGDVKYHLGLDSVRHYDGYDIEMSLANNPSHLEFITPVVMGEVKAKQAHSHAGHFGLSVHGDAAVAGQGIVMEAVAMSKIPAHSIGGMMHVVLDNKIGFTNDNVEDMRSSFGCADIAKLIEAPIFYANADDAEACIKAADLALDYIAKYRRSAFVVIVGYRRHGHNEGDEPSMTSPDIYKVIKSHPVACDLYANKLADLQVVDSTEYQAMRDAYKKRLDDRKATTEHTDLVDAKRDYIEQNWQDHYDFKTNAATLQELAKHFSQVPKDLKFHRSIERLIKQRQSMANGETPLDWGMCELLAYACILSQGHSIRINGQDAERGTFSHRHAVLYAENDARYPIMQSVCAKGAHFDVYNSFLSEQGVLGFEYGYSVEAENDLVVWEAQFGDFANGAQVIIDQFISSGLEKWNQTSKLVMYLPHGYEGMGPEHTSARLERFLQLSAQNNIQVCVPTSPKQMFALLIRQYFRYYDRPLIVLTPKSLLRHPAAVTDFDALANDSQFSAVIDDAFINASEADRVIICSGKVYYDLLDYRNTHQLQASLVRIEQLYPFPDEDLTSLLAQYTHINKFIWCQEEPKNQGAWYTMKSRIEACLPEGNKLTYAGRDAAAAPAVGYHNRHLEEQAKLVSEAFNL